MGEGRKEQGKTTGSWIERTSAHRPFSSMVNSTQKYGLKVTTNGHRIFGDIEAGVSYQGPSQGLPRTE